MKEAPPAEPPPVVIDAGPPRPTLDFVIDTIYEHEQPLPRLPGHAPGGEWTFFDAHLVAGGRFVLGRFDGSAAANFQDTRTEIAVPDADAGVQVIATFAAALGLPVPPARTRGELSFPALLTRERGHLGRRGSGTPYLEFAGDTGYLSLVFDLDAKTGGFSVQHEETALYWLAEHLRDGPRRKRALPATGPKVRTWTPIAMGATILSFSADSKVGFYEVISPQDKTRIMSVPLDDLTNTKEVTSDDVPPRPPPREVSPDGKRRVGYRDGAVLVISDIASGAEKTFAVNPDDEYWFRHTPPTWLDNRYLRFDTLWPGVFDADTMTQSYVDFGTKTGACVYSPDFTVVGCVDQFGRIE